MSLLRHNMVNLLFSLIFPLLVLILGLTWAATSPADTQPEGVSEYNDVAVGLTPDNDVVLVENDLGYTIKLDETQLERIRAAEEFDRHFGSSLTVITKMKDEYGNGAGNTVWSVADWEIERLRSLQASKINSN